MGKDVNKTYEETAQTITHVDPESCTLCGVYDEDTFSSDDIFGRQFNICISDFNDSSHTAKEMPGEFAIGVYCPQCHKEWLEVNTEQEDPELEVVEPQKVSRKSTGPWIAAGVIGGMGTLLIGLVLGIYAFKAYQDWKVQRMIDNQNQFDEIFDEKDADVQELEMVQQEGHPLYPSDIRSWFQRRFSRGNLFRHNYEKQMSFSETQPAIS